MSKRLFHIFEYNGGEFLSSINLSLDDFIEELYRIIEGNIEDDRIIKGNIEDEKLISNKIKEFLLDINEGEFEDAVNYKLFYSECGDATLNVLDATDYYEEIINYILRV